MTIVQVVDSFVALVDPSGQTFQRSDSRPAWFETLEQRLPRRLPVSFSTLLARYRFSPVTIGEIHLFGSCDGASMDDLNVAIFRDRIIATATLEAGFIQFGRPTNESYDPVCFDARHAAKNREYPIVRLDHEEILCRNRIRMRKRIANSFFDVLIRANSRI
jgi:hypothetical protein